MMKKRLTGLLVILSAIFLLMLGCGQPNPYNIQDDGFAVITAPLSHNQGDNTTYIPHGSVIYHWANGITEVYGPDNNRLFIARDSEATSVVAPGGSKPATRTFQVPDGAIIAQEDSNITKITLDDVLILTIIEKSEDF